MKNLLLILNTLTTGVFATDPNPYYTEPPKIDGYYRLDHKIDQAATLQFSDMTPAKIKELKDSKTIEHLRITEVDSQGDALFKVLKQLPELETINIYPQSFPTSLDNWINGIGTLFSSEKHTPTLQFFFPRQILNQIEFNRIRNQVSQWNRDHKKGDYALVVDIPVTEDFDVNAKDADVASPDYSIVVFRHTPIANVPPIVITKNDKKAEK